MKRDLAAALAFAAASACALQPPVASVVPAAPVDTRALVFFPRGACESQTIEIELYDRATQSWRAHPEHPRLTTGRCAELDTSFLLNELRLRCIDPEGEATPSDWVTGFEVAPQLLPCASDESRER